MTEYFIHDGTNQQGPFTLEELKTKGLTSETPIWHEGLDKWTTIGNLAELKNQLLKPTPPPYNSTTAANSQSSQNASSYETTMNEYFPKKKRNKLLPLIIITGIIAAGIIIWLIAKNNQHSDTIKNLEDKVSDERNKNDEKTRADQEKEDEKKRINDELTEKNMNYRNNWERYIKLQTGTPTIDFTLGGISEFTVSVSNETDYILDQVDVRVNYIRKNNDIWQTKMVTFFNVPAKAFETKIAPSSVNGVKVEVEIQKIICKKMHFCYPINNGNSKDPFFCK